MSKKVKVNLTMDREVIEKAKKLGLEDFLKGLAYFSRAFSTILQEIL